MTPELKEAIRRYREQTKGLNGKELENAVNSFRCGNHTQDIYPTK